MLQIDCKKVFWSMWKHEYSSCLELFKAAASFPRIPWQLQRVKHVVLGQDTATVQIDTTSAIQHALKHIFQIFLNHRIVLNENTLITHWLSSNIILIINLVQWAIKRITSQCFICFHRIPVD